MKLVVMDGQGGRLGSLLVETLRTRLPEAEIWAVGTNSIATAAMLKAGATCGATGENPAARAVPDADAVLGPVGIVVAHAILGEVTPAMAEAVGGCRARKFLVPMDSCGVWVAGTAPMGLGDYARQAAEEAVRWLEKHRTREER